MRELSCATRSSLDFLTSSFTAPRLNWLLKLAVGRGGLQNSSFGGAEQPRMIELLVYNVGGQLVLGPCVRGGHLVLAVTSDHAIGTFNTCKEVFSLSIYCSYISTHPSHLESFSDWFGGSLLGQR